MICIRFDVLRLLEVGVHGWAMSNSMSWMGLRC